MSLPGSPSCVTSVRLRTAALEPRGRVRYRSPSNASSRFALSIVMRSCARVLADGGMLPVPEVRGAGKRRYAQSGRDLRVPARRHRARLRGGLPPPRAHVPAAARARPHPRPRPPRPAPRCSRERRGPAFCIIAPALYTTIVPARPVPAYHVPARHVPACSARSRVGGRTCTALLPPSVPGTAPCSDTHAPACFGLGFSASCVAVGAEYWHPTTVARARSGAAAWLRLGRGRGAERGGVRHVQPPGEC